MLQLLVIAKRPSKNCRHTKEIMTADKVIMSIEDHKEEGQEDKVYNQNLKDIPLSKISHRSNRTMSHLTITNQDMKNVLIV